MADKRKIIMDVDTGSDDAVALMMAMLDPRIDLLGVTTVNGNLEVKLTTENTLRMVEFMGRQDSVKVYRGADLPLVSTLLPNTEQSMHPIPMREEKVPAGLHHATHIPTPSFTIKEQPESAAVWLIKTLLASEDGEITLVPVGPLTNIAIAMRADPRIIPKIREIIIMGGGTEGNITPCAEYNVWVDPEAMEIVLQSGCPITLCSLDSTHAGYLTKQDAEEIRAIGTPKAAMAADLILKYGAGGDLSHEGAEVQRIPIHDALAVCSVVYPQVLKVKECNCHTDISKGFGYGQTMMDRREGQYEPHNCRFGVGADRELFRSWIIDLLTADRDSSR